MQRHVDCIEPGGRDRVFVFGKAFRMVDRIARRAGTPPDRLALEGPDAATGVAGLLFIDACLRSTHDGGWVDCPDV